MWRPSSPLRCHKRRTGQQKQNENYPAERVFIELPIKHPAEPSPNPQGRQSEQGQADSVDGNDPDAAESHDDHKKAHNTGRLKDGSLLIARPAAHARPDNSDNSGEPGSASDHAVENAYSHIRSAACLLHLRQFRPSQVVEAKEDEQQAHADPEIYRRSPAYRRNANRNSQRAAQDERHEPMRIEQM